ncbi:hypothetical protein HHK36_009277 [Tetracentron sinense]|uniref:Dof zinc finger protein n=1 Tax=Tetracentron sinense TaxID=13715 RepID=A0A834ZAL5_TETSI|nr:hypothetical protein HHK36_009277 [Tetracentron sinense]
MYRPRDTMLPCPPRPLMMDRRWKTNVELAPNCPRCASPKTKFCYYNNYSLSQPRYFCKSCRRYWTKGGSLRNVPVGGGCRKSRRGKSDRLPSSQSEPIPYRPSSSLSSSDHPQINHFNNSCLSHRADCHDIDLAVVFAKFLNHDSHFDLEPPLVEQELPNDVDASFNLSHSSNHIQFTEEDDLIIEDQRLSDLSPESQLIDREPSQVFQGKIQQQEIIPQFMSADPNCFGLPALLSNEAVQGVLWSDIPAVQNFTWQSPQLPEFETVQSAGDHSMFYPNQLNDNWSLFDLSSYGASQEPET